MPNPFGMMKRAGQGMGQGMARGAMPMQQGGQGIGPSNPMALMKNKGQMGDMASAGARMGMGQKPMMQPPMNIQPQPMPDMNAYQQAGMGAGQDMSWMQQPGAISPEYMQPQPGVGPSQGGIQALLAKMRMKNTGVAGGRPRQM